MPENITEARGHRQLSTEVAWASTTDQRLVAVSAVAGESNLGGFEEPA